VLFEYFVGALADAPASARLDMIKDTERIASAAVVLARTFSISASIRFETTQTEQALDVSYATAPVRRLVVPAGEHDPDFREAQESIN
jgi:hypothetical protein